MVVLDIIPLSKTAPIEPLSYRSSIDVKTGTIVNVPLRKKIVPGLVVGSRSVQEAKAELKNASFTILKSDKSSIGSLPSTLLTSAETVATYHATNLGSVLSAMLVPVMSEHVPSKLATGNGFSTDRIEDVLLERQKKYERVIKNTGTTMLVVPTQAEVIGWSEYFKSLKPVVLSGALSAKKREAIIERLQKEKITLLITTPSFSWIPLPSLDRIIIERTSAGGYTLPKRPYIDVRYALTELARVRKISIAYGDYPLPLEYRANPRKPLSSAPSANIRIFDARRDENAQNSDGPWKAVPDELVEVIKKTIGKKGRVLVLAVRKGYAPTVVCRDCGMTVTDEYGRTLTFVIENGKRLFRSVDGATVEAAHRSCKNCGSWNLLPLGVGIERVEEELRTAFPKANVVRLDQDSLSSSLARKKNEEIEKPGTIVLGTETMLPWISTSEPFALGIIASADSLLALPFWRSRERFVRVGLMMAERVKKLVVATRHPEDAALSAVLSPAASDFWKEELELRKLLHYPPFGTLVVFQIEANSMRLAQARAALSAACAPHTLIDLPPRKISPSLLRGVSVLHLPQDAWPDKKLSQRLAQLSPVIRIHLDSESFW